MYVFNIILTLFLVGCNPSQIFQVGDCVREVGYDSFDSRIETQEIKKAGEYSYCTIEYNNEWDIKRYSNYGICKILYFKFQHNFQKVKCE